MTTRDLGVGQLPAWFALGANPAHAAGCPRSVRPRRTPRAPRPEACPAPDPSNADALRAEMSPAHGSRKSRLPPAPVPNMVSGIREPKERRVYPSDGDRGTSERTVRAEWRWTGLVLQAHRAGDDL